MKKSRIAKIALMGASVTALAATLTTSTYAWYVSNKTADVVGGTGTTGTAGADKSIQVSWTGADGTWYNRITYTSQQATVAGELLPLHFDGTAFYGLDNTTGGAATSANTTNYIQFTVWLISGSNASVTPEFTITNSTGTLPKQMVISEGASHTPTASDGKFTVDALKALYIQQNADSALSYQAADATPTGGNAHNYYNAVKPSSDHVLLDAVKTTAAADANSSSLTDIQLAAGVKESVTYTLFLDGGDVDCFNA